jgi:hypothetical protein
MEERGSMLKVSGAAFSAIAVSDLMANLRASGKFKEDRHRDVEAGPDQVPTPGDLRGHLPLRELSRWRCPAFLARSRTRRGRRSSSSGVVGLAIIGAVRWFLLLSPLDTRIQA